MKRILTSAILMGICMATAFAEKAGKKGTASDVIVEMFPSVVPNNIPQANKIIWDFITKRSEQQWFIHYSTKDWRKNYDAFSIELVAKAQIGRMDYEQLAKLLKILPSDPCIKQGHVPERACLPIGAYPVVIQGEKLWLIFCLWEYAVDPSKTKYVAAPKVDGSADNTEQKRNQMDWETVSHVLAIVYYPNGDVFTFVACD